MSSFAKAKQLLRLAWFVAARRAGVTLDEVVEEFGGSLRTVQRMLGALEEIFPDVTGAFGEDGRKRWRMSGGHFRELMTLESDELTALDLAVGDLERTGHGFEAHALRRLKDKVLSLVPRTKMARIETDHEALLEALGFVARPGPRPKVDEQAAAVIAGAIKSCHLVEFNYRARGASEAKRRRVAPYGLLSGVRRYLVGRQSDDPSGPERKYRLDALEDVHPTEEPFVRPEDFDLREFSNRAFGVFQSDEEYGDVVWRFCPEAAEHARGYEFHPLQTMEDQPDGSLVVRFRAAGYLEMCWHLYTWGDRVEVLAPVRLRQMVEDHRRGDFPAMP